MPRSRPYHQHRAPQGSQQRSEPRNQPRDTPGHRAPHSSQPRATPCARGTSSRQSGAPPIRQSRAPPSDKPSRSSQATPIYNPSIVRPEEVSAAKEENVYGDRLCKICSDKDHSVHHHHTSTQNIRNFASKYQKGYLFLCIMCKASESVVRPQTRKIILTDSTLFNVWTSQELKLNIHIEMESIVGGRVRDMTRTLIMSYTRFPERLEIIVISGINNIGDGQAAEEIVDEFSELKEVVKKHSVVNNHTEPSVVSISTLLYAPKFCSLDNPAPNWIPPPSFINRRKEMEQVNAAIIAMNKAEGINYLNLHYEGTRQVKGTGQTMHRHNTVTPIWRETQVRRRLHLTPQFKVKVVNRAATIFRGGLKNLGEWNK